MSRKIQIVIALVIVVIGIGGWWYLGNRTPYAQQRPAIGEFAPQITLADMNGAMVKLADYKGKVVLVNFWASWCPPCTNEMPGFEKMFEAFESKGFAVIGISLDDIKPPMVRDLRITYPLVKINERVSREYGDVTSVPQSFLVGADGAIIKKVNQFYPENELKADIEQALAQRKP